MEQATLPTLPELLARMDAGWTTFIETVRAQPNERLEAHLAEGAWTRKQMLAHIATWHDLTADRINRLRDSGTQSDAAEHEDVINAQSARAASGRTTGEIIQTMEDSFRRLRRQVSQLSDEQLAANDWWAVAIVRGNTFGHYEEHLPDLTGRA